MTQTEKDKSILAYWLEWIAAYKQWWRDAPEGVYMPAAQDVNGVPYEALDALAEHFKTKVGGEDRDHKKFVTIEVWRGMSCVMVAFRSPARPFTYKPLKKAK